MKLVLAAAGGAAWAAAVPALATLAVLGGPGPAGGEAVAAPASATPAIASARATVGATGWYRLCDRLACRAYGYANSGYHTALLHWNAMTAAGLARPGDRCPPPGSFAFWRTGSGIGHVALVTAADSYCDPARIHLVSNDVLDRENGTFGGVYEVSLTRIETGFVSRANYLGWSDPVCAGARATTG